MRFLWKIDAFSLKFVCSLGIKGLGKCGGMFGW